MIDAFENGDAASVDAIYERLIGVVDGTICRIMGRREPDHADLVQSSFEQIVLTLTRGHFARACSLGAWAAAIATHVALKSLRSRINERRVLDRSAAHGVFLAERTVRIHKELRHDEERNALGAVGRTRRLGQHQMDDIVREILIATRNEDLGA